MEFWLISSALVATPPALAALPGAKSTPCSLQVIGRLQRGGHVRALGHSDAAVFNQRLRVLQPQLVLRRARQGHVAFDASRTRRAPRDTPRSRGAAAYSVMRARRTSLTSLSSATSMPCRVVNPAGGIGHGDHLRAELLGLLARRRWRRCPRRKPRPSCPRVSCPLAASIASVRYSRP